MLFVYAMLVLLSNWIMWNVKNVKLAWYTGTLYIQWAIKLYPKKIDNLNKLTTPQIVSNIRLTQRLFGLNDHRLTRRIKLNFWCYVGSRTSQVIGCLRSGSELKWTPRIVNSLDFSSTWKLWGVPNLTCWLRYSVFTVSIIILTVLD